MSARKAGSSARKGSPARGVKRGRTPLEIAVLGLSLLAIAAVVVLLLTGEGRVPSGPPHLRATVQLAGERSGGAAYEVRVRNDGGETAENIEVDVTVGSQTRTLHLTAVARDDEEHGTVIFPTGTSGAARAEVVSYSEPAR